jgi:hypothetical protein
MRVAHLILTYTDPVQTKRMIEAMWHEDFDFYLHLDKKSDITPHLFLGNIPNVYFIENRIDVRWSGFSTITAEFETIKEVVATGRNYNFLNLLSGQDYPICSAQTLADFFRKNIGNEFLSYKDFKREWPEGLIRINNYYLSDYNFTGKYSLERLMSKFLPAKQIPNNMHPYGKSMFWMLSPEVAMHVVNTVEKDAKLRRFFKLSWASDEFVFQTVIMNSPFRDKVINENYRYIDWSGGGSSPKTLDETDYEFMMHSGMLIARKVSAEVSGVLLDLIDRSVSSEKPIKAK